jgi:crotonobetainyl-CoA:carnitine CoA-transferase CaiB-like acyl-CoA transferase
MSLGSIGHQVADVLGVEQWVDHIRPPSGMLPWTSALPVGELATDSVGISSLALNLARHARLSTDVTSVQVGSARVAASFASERILRIDGEPPAVWAPLSGFWPAADGFVRTHANYPHHERALRGLLALGGRATKTDVAQAIAEWNAVDVESAAARLGAVVGAVRSPEEWQEHAQARVIASTPLVELDRFAGAPPRGWSDDAPPLGGIRVLDLTRVLAGPIAARDLALAGAGVLRVDAPFLPETGWIHLDTGQGKRSTRLDLRDRRDLDEFQSLLSTADVLLTGYRPGALATFGLDPETLAEQHPGLVTGSVSAWGTSGPWAGRRGFDSIVQAVTGISHVESPDGVAPGALPAQALDHSTGHFLAAAITLGLIEQRASGGSIDVRMSLARVGHALLESPGGPTVAPPTIDSPPSRTRDLEGRGARSLTYAPPVLAFEGAPDDYPVVGGEWGTDPPRWSGTP